MARIPRRTVQERLKDADNHDGVVMYLELDSLKCEVKWASGSITMNKAGGGDGITAEVMELQLRYF